MPSKKHISLAASAVILSAVSINSHAEWNYQLTPYLWGAGLDGSTALAGQEVDFKADFGDLISFVDAGVAARFEAKSDRWGYFIDGFFIKLSADSDRLAGAAKVTNDQKLVEAGLSYALSEQFDLIIGGRYQKIDQDLSLPVVPELNGGDSWLDGFVGAVWQPVKTDKWSFRLRGDIGAGDSDGVWQVAAGGGYHFNKTWSLLVNYRYLSTDFESDKFKWDVDQSGLGVGLGISW